jgi:signal transduction histidine kinase
VIFARRRRAFAWHTAVFVALNALFILVWGTTTAAYFWPEWPLLALGLILSTHALVLAVDERADRLRARGIPLAVAVDAGVVSLLALFETCIWALTSHGYFWPAWSFLGFAIVVGVHALVARRSGSARRIAVLETTRAGAVDQQDSELRRIERDLHDGAQARLVALGMSLGMAEQKLAFDPGAAATLLAEARQSAHDALEELRDLARGIHPPVLADRGLEAAISALASRSPQPVELTVNLPTRPAPAVETAVYFVVAESLANAGKHAAASRVDVEIHARAKALVVDITDDGPGGADPAGSGLRGLARRVEALDGTLAVTSPEGGPTTIEAVIPCAW